MRKALFLDRDGVINLDYGYVHKINDFVFIDGIFEVVHLANKLNYLVIIVTNQAGIGRGLYTESDFLELCSWMKSEFIKHSGVIDAIYYCPYHAEEGIGKYRKESNMRKPNPGMLLKACKDFDIDMKNSIMVGDNESDMLAAHRANVGTLFHLNPKNSSSTAGQAITTLKKINAHLLRTEN